VHLEEKYLKHCDLNVPVQWVAANVARLVCPLSSYSSCALLAKAFANASGN
jgi:hypothetical protein